MVFRILEWGHCDWIQYGGRYVTCSRDPMQSKTISALPKRSLCNLLMLRRIKWIAMRPSSSPMYMFAINNTSENVPMTRLWPLEYSRMNVVEHRKGKNSWMYDPSVTATREPLGIEPQSQDMLPVIVKCSHSEVIPHD
jgi:hypothetical protein